MLIANAGNLVMTGLESAHRVVAAGLGHDGRPMSSNDAIDADSIPAPLSILVLPFVNQTGDEKKAYIADALTMSITALTCHAFEMPSSFPR